MIRVGIFTKMDMAGGSEFRAVEMANAIAQVPGHESVLMCEKALPERVRARVGSAVELREGIFSKPDVAALYSVDHLLVINTDSRHFTTAAYWLGESPLHPHKVALSRLRQMTFLFNFIVSPACSLPSLREQVADVRIIAANGKFFDEISRQDRYEAVRHYPRLQLESPIHPSVALPKTASDRVRIGMHSLPASGKWNDEFPELVRLVNARHGTRVQWDFMGMPRRVRSRIQADNVIFRDEFSVPVGEFLAGLDVFAFFLQWKREEPWARASGEALISGCPVVTTDRGGNKNQVVHGNTGFLCRTLEEFADACGKLVEDASLREAMRANAQRAAQHFTSDAVVRRFLDFIR